ncbi:hypothetical protein M407DRAFT_245142 [Tulasnella calospora MUT 4182]|uniref:Uncharacterized protein n=1 Tax=Tulasnella calospora MUT 4182 TaxID=1051891 RepID=A0A0C3QBI7_9AGAM|nr:hypothetical protein M407DRAFT_245142 [Tulasnella calospora MUT 4182]
MGGRATIGCGGGWGLRSPVDDDRLDEVGLNERVRTSSEQKSWCRRRICCLTTSFR